MQPQVFRLSNIWFHITQPCARYLVLTPSLMYFHFIIMVDAISIHFEGFHLMLLQVSPSFEQYHGGNHLGSFRQLHHKT